MDDRFKCSSCGGFGCARCDGGWLHANAPKVAPPASTPVDPSLMHHHNLASKNTLTAIRAALSRAAFHLRQMGNGQFDNEQAAVLESLIIGEPTE